MKVIFDWECNELRRVCRLSAEYVRLGPAYGECAVGIYKSNNGYTVLFWDDAYKRLPSSLACETSSKRFDTLNIAMAYADNILEWAGYKTLPVEYKTLI